MVGSNRIKELRKKIGEFLHMGSAESFVNILEKKQYLLLVVFGLTVLLWAVIPFTARGAVGTAVQKELAPTVLKIASIEATQVEIKNDVAAMEENLSTGTIEGAIAAYNGKFCGLTGQDLIDKLESASQNTVAVKNALRMKKSYDILYQMDRSLTLEICEYYGIERPE